MSWVAVGVGAGAVGSALISSGGAKKASQAQSQATQEATAEARRQYDLSRKDLAPYRMAGDDAVARVGQLLGLGSSSTYGGRAPEELNAMLTSLETQKAQNRDQFGNTDPVFDKEIASVRAAMTGGSTPSDVMAMDPGYQFRLDEGLKSGRNIAGARGMLNSGATAKALTRYGQDYASGEFNNIYNRLAGVAGLGQNATNTGVQAGQNYAGNVGNMITGLGNARGASAIGQSNAWGNAFNTVGGYFGQQNTLDKILASRNTGSMMSPYNYNSMAPS